MGAPAHRLCNLIGHKWLWPWQTYQRCAVCGRFRDFMVGEHSVQLDGTNNLVRFTATGTPTTQGEFAGDTTSGRLVYHDGTTTRKTAHLGDVILPGFGATTPPLTTDFGTGINLGSSAITQAAAGHLHIEIDADATLQMRLWPVSYTGTKRIRIYMRQQSMDVSGEAGIGLFFRRSATGKFVAFLPHAALFGWGQFNSESSLSNYPWNVTNHRQGPEWIEIFDNGTDRLRGNYSIDGETYSSSDSIPDSVSPELYTGFLGAKPDQYGICGFSNNSFGINAVGAAFHWEVTSS